MNNDSVIFNIFDTLDDGIVLHSNKTSISKANLKAKDWGIT